MQAKIDEIADGIYRLSVHVPDIAPPAGFTFNHFLVHADEPMLFHCGLRGVSPAVGRGDPAHADQLAALHRLRTRRGRRMRRDEFMARRRATRAGRARRHRLHGLAQRSRRPAPRTLTDGELLDLGGKRVRYIDTPHVPHGWEAGVLHEEATGTLLCGDLFTHVGNGLAITDKDVVGPAIEAERMFHYTSLGPSTAPNIRKLAALAPRTLAVMHGASYHGDGARALHALADHYDAELRTAVLQRAA